MKAIHVAEAKQSSDEASCELTTRHDTAEYLNHTVQAERHKWGHNI